MRLVEIAPPNYGREQAATLLTILNHIQNKVGNGTEVPFDRVVQLMGNAGYPFDYQTFTTLYNTVPSLNNIVTNHDAKTIAIGKTQPDTVGPDDSGATVDRMAKHAAKTAVQ